ncbi:hypothetical protein [Chryseolinea sp. H1M3-3]|uniref:hypothetical protein n=1 Tax=Chryseolinea sp. H1M3-3 TaxID=3034144 RepID=UPI0023EB183A|nr:hypothetical protein [Chryseolinea sp. H1M3-3]
MKVKKIVLLFLALLFPACVFVFLKFFGKNEFNVPPLYTDVYPEGVSECGVNITLPYHIPDSVMSSLQLSADSLTLIHFGELNTESRNQLSRVKKEHGMEVKTNILDDQRNAAVLKKCVFFLKEPFDLVLIDDEGVIRGQYVSGDRDEIDRLLMELSILFKKF